MNIYIHTHICPNIYMEALITFAMFRGAYKSPLILLFTFPSMYFHPAQAEALERYTKFPYVGLYRFSKVGKERKALTLKRGIPGEEGCQNN